LDEYDVIVLRITYGPSIASFRREPRHRGATQPTLTYSGGVHAPTLRAAVTVVAAVAPVAADCAGNAALVQWRTRERLPPILLLKHRAHARLLLLQALLLALLLLVLLALLVLLLRLAQLLGLLVLLLALLLLRVVAVAEARAPPQARRQQQKHPTMLQEAHQRPGRCRWMTCRCRWTRWPAALSA
jgi:hypothetical protein